MFKQTQKHQTLFSHHRFKQTTECRCDVIVRLCSPIVFDTMQSKPVKISKSGSFQLKKNNMKNNKRKYKNLFFVKLLISFNTFFLSLQLWPIELTITYIKLTEMS